MLFGLSLGLMVAAAVYLNGLRTQGTPVAVTVTAPPSPTEAPGAGAASADAVTENSPEQPPRFEFYEILPKFEVVLPETELEARPDVTETALEEPGPATGDAAEAAVSQPAPAGTEPRPAEPAPALLPGEPGPA